MEALLKVEADEEQRDSHVRVQDTRAADVMTKIGERVWRAVFDGAKLGKMVLIYWKADAGWRLWGTAAWLDGRLQTPTARVVDPVVLEELGRVIGRALEAA